jgi:streptomycin 6-kinase
VKQPTIAIPDSLIRNRIDLHGDAGRQWAAALPGLIAGCADRWSLTLHPPFPRLSYNYAAPVTRADGTPAVLKVCYRDKEFYTEEAALRIYNGRGASRLLESDLDQGALLLERLEPGAPLSSLADDEQATSIAAAVMRELWRPAPAEHRFPTTADWFKGFARTRAQFGGGTGPLPRRLFEHGEALFADLLASQAEAVVLHGDLHHGNILAAQRQPWLAIDPKGIVGEPAYEVGALLPNPSRLQSEPLPAPILARRVDQLADELRFDRARVRGWGVAQAVLSACWSVEDHGRGWEWAIRCAELLAALPE